MELSDNFPVKNEFIINIINSNFTRISMDIPTQEAIRSLMDEKPLHLMQAGFLPFVPVPVLTML